MSVTIRDLRRDDRDQLTWLVNLHVSTVIRGVALSTNVVLAQLEREPGEVIVDPWVAERRCLVAVSEHNIVAASLLLRYASGEEVGDAYQGAAEIRWLIGLPGRREACRSLLDESIGILRGWDPTHIYADGALPAPGCYGIPDSWPHVRRLLVDAGFDGPARTELALAAPCARLVGRDLDGVSVRRSVGDLGARLDGFYGDSAVTVPIGRVSTEAERLLAVTQASLERAIGVVKAGARVHDIGAAVQQYVEANGFSVVREFVGHGIGTSLHEEPQIPNYGTPGRGSRLAEGMVLAIEPMVNAGKAAVKVLADGWTAVTRDGSLSAHFEHTVVVTEDGCRVLTLRDQVAAGAV